MKNLAPTDQISEGFTDDAKQFSKQFSKLVSIAKEKYRNFLILITLQKVTDSNTFIWFTSGMWKVLKSWLSMENHRYTSAWASLLKEASVLTNPSLQKICPLNGACMTTWSKKMSPLNIWLFGAYFVKASEV